MSNSPPPSVRLSPAKVRHLNAEELGRGSAPPASPPDPDEISTLPPDDPILERTRDLLKSFGGVIFVGPPGTSKSWYAARVGLTLADGHEVLVRRVQFHPSYQYEDFVEGFVPSRSGGFNLRDKHFLEMCELARANPDKSVVLVIDELSRGDPGRVFGEALTYIDRTWRDKAFSLTSGRSVSVPQNLVILATMNPLDRGVDEVDAALERRFSKISMEPDPEVLGRLLGDAGMEDALRDRLVTFFRTVNARATANPFVAVGHTYFIGANDVEGLTRLWEHQLKFHFDKAYRLDPEGREDVDRLWNRVLGVAEAAPETNGSAPPEAEPEVAAEGDAT